MPKLDCYRELAKTEDDTIKELVDWTDTVVNCRKVLTLHIKRQAGRNVLLMKQEHQKQVIQNIIKVGAIMGHYLKYFHDLGLSTMNIDMLSKGVVLNSITSLKWIDRRL